MQYYVRANSYGARRVRQKRILKIEGEGTWFRPPLRLCATPELPIDIAHRQEVQSPNSDGRANSPYPPSGVLLHLLFWRRGAGDHPGLCGLRGEVVRTSEIGKI